MSEHLPASQPEVFAHRGGRAWAPENTISAFSKALELGVDGVELDVQRLASGELVVFHDQDLSRTTNGAGRLADCTYDELGRLSAGSWFDEEFSDQRVPALTEVLELINGRAVINIEIKNMPVQYPGIEDDLADILADYPHRDKIVVSSFDHQVIKRMSSLASDLLYAVLMVGVPADIVAYARELSATYWHPNHGYMTESAVAAALSAGIKVVPWTVNKAADWSRCMKMGVDGIITDDPAQLKAFLKEVEAVR